MEMGNLRNKSEMMQQSQYSRMQQRSQEKLRSLEPKKMKYSLKKKAVQNSPTFEVKSPIGKKKEELLDQIINKNISQNIRANLRMTKKHLEEVSPKKTHKYSKTFTHIDEIPGVFTFINNQVSVDCSNKERSLSPHSGRTVTEGPTSKFNSDINNNIFFTMKPSMEDEVKLKKYLSMKNLAPQIPSPLKPNLKIGPLNEVRESLEFGEEVSANRKKKDNIFFEEFSEERSKGIDSNAMSTTSFKKVNLTKRSIGREKEHSTDRKSTFSKSYSEFSNADNKISKEPFDSKRKIYSQRKLPDSSEVEDEFLNTFHTANSSKLITKIGPKRTSILHQKGNNENEKFTKYLRENEKFKKEKGKIKKLDSMENKLTNNGKDFITFTDLKQSKQNLSSKQLK